MKNYFLKFITWLYHHSPFLSITVENFWIMALIITVSNIFIYLYFCSLGSYKEKNWFFFIHFKWLKKMNILQLFFFKSSCLVKYEIFPPFFHKYWKDCLLFIVFMTIFFIFIIMWLLFNSQVSFYLTAPDWLIFQLERSLSFLISTKHLWFKDCVLEICLQDFSYFNWIMTSDSKQLWFGSNI